MHEVALIITMKIYIRPIVKNAAVWAIERHLFEVKARLSKKKVRPTAFHTSDLCNLYENDLCNFRKVSVKPITFITYQFNFEYFIVFFVI